MSYAKLFDIKKLVVAVNLALLTLMAYFTVSLFYQYVGIQVKAAETATTAAAAPNQARPLSIQTVAYYNPIIERDLFKVAKTAQAPEAPPTELDNLKKTDLNLKLWGTVSGDAEKAYAVIEDNQKREQNLYRIGDTIQNATVKMILREKVVLSVDGKDEILTMEELDQDSGSPMMASRRGGRGSAISMPQRPPREQRITIERSMIDNAFQDVNKLMTDIAVTPHVEDGVTNGLNLNRIQPNSIFRRMGLRNGDVLLGVNGQPILTVEDAMQMYNNLRTSEDVQLQLKRRGQERTINYNIR